MSHSIQRGTGGGSQAGPGSNRKGHLSRADWRFLLPGVRGARILLLGPPSEGELSALSAEAAAIIVAIAEERSLDRARRVVALNPLGNVSVIRVSSRHSLPLATDGVDIVAIPEMLTRRTLLSPPAAHRDLGRVLADGGTAHFTSRGPAGDRLARRWVRRCLGPSRTPQSYWTVWRKGSMRAALPGELAPKLAGYFFRNALYGRSRTGRLLNGAANALARVGLLHRAVWTRSTVVVRDVPGTDDDRPFAHIRRLAGRNGLDLDQHRVALLTSAAYDSNKTAFFAFTPDGTTPEVILKATRTPLFNHRLEREFGSLRRLEEESLAQAGTYPAALFVDEHEGLTVVAERVVVGAPFRTATTARPDCELAGRAIDWIVGLASRSAELETGNRAILADRLESMLARLDEAYTRSDREMQFLQRQVETFRGNPGEIPLVFRHGDAGTWNILVTAAGQPAFLDWELSESSGPPLWDLLDFTRSYASWVARVSGERKPLRTYRRSLLDEGPVEQLERTAVRRYCQGTGLGGKDVEPLFYFYWVDRALRQAAWAEGPLANAKYIRMLAASIDGRGGPTLRSLFSTVELDRPMAAAAEDAPERLAVAGRSRAAGAGGSRGH